MITITLLTIAGIAILYYLIGLCIRSYYNQGETITQSKSLQDISHIDFRSIGKLVVTQSSADKLEVQSKHRYLPQVSPEAKGPTLTLKEDQGLIYNLFAWALPKPTYYVSVAQLDRLSIAGTGEIEIPELKATNLAIDGAGMTTVDANLAIEDTLDVKISGSIKATLRGSVKNQSLTISGNSRYDASDMVAQSTTLQMAGNSQASVHVQRSLDGTIGGSAQATYIGTPSISQSLSNSGKLRNTK